uniref:Uncharacterized protein n=1 Tax=viral metagenome TaxID=1070528 RepID=A0A6C0JW83_9ZZZZ
MKDSLPENEFNAIEVTLKCLANSVYQEILKKKQVQHRTLEEYNLYSKQVDDMMQDMLKGIYVTDIIKEAHMDMVNLMIEYIKVQEKIKTLSKRCKKVTFDILPNTKESDANIETKQCIIDLHSFDKKVFPLFHTNKLHE